MPSKNSEPTEHGSNPTTPNDNGASDILAFTGAEFPDDERAQAIRVVGREVWQGATLLARF